MKTSEFDYQLPPEYIAQQPVEPRDSSRLMVVERETGAISHHVFRDLLSFLQPGDLLVHNESRVIPARIFARKPTGGQVEILLLRPRSDDTWETLVRGRGVRSGLQLSILEGSGENPQGCGAQVIEEGDRGLRVLAFDCPALDLAEEVGETPLPPYIHEDLRNPERYQTVYSRIPGSAAAPTAGLHFTPELLLQARDMGVHSEFVMLHIGLDTFRPVSEDLIEDHRMHTEFCTIRHEVAARINQTRLQGGRIVAVGTTSVRVLETAARRGTGLSPDDGTCPMRSVAPFSGDTDLFIYPGHDFRAVDVMITNFHLPRSTLLMLVAAFCGKDLLDKAYAAAIEERYRFYSFGDAMLIL